MFPPGLHRAEQGTAERLRRLNQGQPPGPGIELERVEPRVEDKIGIRRAPSQQEALRLALVAKMLVITGGPGVGKTTLVRSILAVPRVKAMALALAAPTGRTAKRHSEVTGLEANTIACLL